MAAEKAEPTVNGESSAVNTEKSPAALLQEQHERDEAHRATVEEVVDEEDIAHPPPSAAEHGDAADSNTTPTPDTSTQPMSEKAAGKQKAQDGRGPATGAAKAPGPAKVLDTQSEESFPALGGGPKARAPAAVPMAWGARKAAAANKGAPNGLSNGLSSGQPLSSTSSSRASTPVSGVLTPSSTNASVAPQTYASRNGPRVMAIPGKHIEHIQFAPSQMMPRSQLKKPVKAIIDDISKRSKAKLEMRSGPSDSIIFEGKGPVDAVRQALKEVAQQVGSKQSVRVPIPASSRPHVIGRQGAVVQGISQRTGARVQVPRAEDSTAGDDDDDSVTIDVLIEGDAVAAEMARREIESIVNESTSNVNMRLKEIPPEFFPFIAGAHNARVNAMEEGKKVQIRVPQYDIWSHQPPPQVPASNQRPTFVPHPDRHIHISGDRLAALEARAEIERHVEELRRQITLQQLAINRGQHQFIVGDRSGSMHDFLAETGCAVILPPDSDSTEVLTITGPADQIELGVNKAMDLATSMQMASVEFSRQHLNAPNGAEMHARALSQYFQRRQAIKELERSYNAHIVLPTSSEGPVTWEVYSRDGKNTIRARSDILNLIQAHPPARLAHVDVDPFFHEHLHEHCPRMQDQFGVHLIVPDEEESTQVLLVYEGPSGLEPQYQPSRQRPSNAEVAEFENALREAQEHILSLIGNRGEILGKTLEVPKK